MDYLGRACKYLIKNNLTISTAESLTGGMIASRLVDIAGISSCFNYGFVTYSNTAKEKILGVKSSTIDEFGVVSKETAREMAKYVREKTESNIGVASTGIAGPGGGNTENPVGTVYLSCAVDKYVVTRKYIFKGNRYLVRYKSTNAAIKLLYDCLKRYKPLP